MERLTDKQKAWIDYYKQGKTPAEAAKLAGYECTNNHSYDIIGSENLKKLERHIVDRDAVIASSRIATMEEINEFWTSVMNDEEKDIKDRLKASELRAKAAGGFVDKVQIGGNVNVNTGKLDGILKQLESDDE